MTDNFTIEYAFLQTVRAVINKRQPPSLPEGVTAQDVYNIGYKQKMVTLTLSGLQSINPKPVCDNWDNYTKTFAAGCMNSELLMAEYQDLIEYLCRNGVKIIPLKGCVINQLYPFRALRDMSDIDLLYDGVDSKELARLMEEYGYVTDRLDSGPHDIFHRKDSVYSIELHRKLLSDNNPYCAVLDNMFDKAIPDAEIENLFHLKPEDLYIHIIVHAAKHLNYGGIGVRPLCDIYVLNKEYRGKWNQYYLTEQFRSGGLEKFESRARCLADTFFGEETMEIPEFVLDALFNVGLYGKDEAWSYKVSGAHSRILYILQLVFSPISYLRRFYPILDRYPILLPAAWMYRIFNILFVRFNHTRDVVSTITKEESIRVRQIMNFFALN